MSNFDRVLGSLKKDKDTTTIEYIVKVVAILAIAGAVLYFGVWNLGNEEPTEERINEVTANQGGQIISGEVNTISSDFNISQ